MDTRGSIVVYLISLTLWILTVCVVVPVRCETDVNECNNGTACMNNGVCTNNNSNFTCDCTGTGFVGDICEINVSIKLLNYPNWHVQIYGYFKQNL